MADNPLTDVRAKLKEAVTKSLDEAVVAAESTLVSLWERDARGELNPAHIWSLVESYHQALKKLALPPIKKVKLAAPLRKIPPLAEPSIRPALDVAMLLAGCAAAPPPIDTPTGVLAEPQLAGAEQWTYVRINPYNKLVAGTVTETLRPAQAGNPGIDIRQSPL